MSNTNYYRVLGIEPNASDEELKKAFKALFDRYNPENNPNSLFLKTMFQQLNEAYEVLGDKDKREKYNLANGYTLPIAVPVAPVVERNISSTPIRENREKPNEKDNKAYLFLFIIIGLIIAVGGYFAYSNFGSNEEGVINDVENVVSTEENVPNSSREMKEKIEQLIDEGNEDNKNEVPVVVAKANDNVDEVVKPAIIVNDKSTTDSKVITPSNERNKQQPTSEKSAKEDKNTKTTTGSIESPKRDEKEGEFGHKKYFKVGSTKNEVWASQGDPSDVLTQGDVEVWFYGKSKVRFKNDKVIDYSNTSGRLNVKK